VLKQEHIQITSARDEAFRTTALPPKFSNFHDESSPFGNQDSYVDLLSTHYRRTFVKSTHLA